MALDTGLNTSDMLGASRAVDADHQLRRFKRQYLQWLTSVFPNAWITGSGVSLYVRRSHRPINGFPTQCMDLANASSDCVRGIGALLSWIEQHRAADCVYVENILDPRLMTYLERRGYVMDLNGYGLGRARCMYKVFS